MAAALLRDERKRLTISLTRKPKTTTPVRADHQLGADDELTSWVLHKLNDPVICDGFFKNLRQAVDELPPHERFYIPTLAKLGVLLFDLPLVLDEVHATGNGNAGNELGLVVELDRTDLLIILAFLGSALLVRFRQSDDSADLEESVRVGRRAASMIPQNHPFRAACLSGLSDALKLRFGVGDDLADLNEAIEFLRLNVQETPDAHPRRARRLTLLGHELAVRFEETSNTSDLDEMVLVAQEAAGTARTDRDRALKYNNWSYMLSRRFDWLGDPDDLDQAVKLVRLALDGLPDTHSKRWLVLNNLSYVLIRQFEHFGNRSDIDAAIDAARQAADMASDHDRTAVLPNLGNALKRRFQWFGDLDDINRAIDSLRTAAASALHDGFGSTPFLTDLAHTLRTRFEWTRNRFSRADDLSDLDEAISLLSKVAETTPDERPGKVMCLENLMLALSTRFQQTGNAKDLDQAVAAGTDMLQILPENHRSRSMYLHDMADTLMARFELTRNPDDITRAIHLLRQSTALCPPNHPQYGSFLARLGLALLRKTRLADDHTDLNEAIETLEQAAQHTSVDHLHWGLVRLYLSDALHHRFEATGSPADADITIKWLRTVAEEPTAVTRERMRAASNWGAFAALQRRDSDALDGFLVALRLLPLAAWQGARRTDREEFLTQWSGIASNAAACAIAAGQFDRALDLLEQGRGVLWSQQSETRAQLSKLRSTAPDLALRLTEVREALDSPRTPPGISGADGTVDRRTALVHEWDDLLARVRARPGFDTFLLPTNATNLRTAGSAGPVVVVNVSSLRCDALVITNGVVDVVPLPKLTSADAIERTNRYLTALHRRERDTNTKLAADEFEQTLSSVLGWLWDAIAEPILTFLGYTHTPSAGAAWPRLWWCPTGALTLLPLHAAGHREEASVLDRVISSYTSTLRALDQAQAIPLTDLNTTGLLVVTMPTTSGQTPLPGATRERDLLTTLFPSGSVTVLEGADARREDVRQHLDIHRCVHFVCHGRQDLSDPFGGGLLLEDGQLTVAEFGTASHHHGEFAFLGACQTAVGGIRIPDEAITMVAALQCSGWRHVIGTLWPVEDRSATRTTASFYARTITDGAFDPSVSAQALHHTVRELRDRYGTRLSAWAPFIHTGP